MTEQTPATEPEVVEQQPNQEAAKWRRQLRETEAERDTLRSRVEAMQRSEVERLAAGRLAKPASLWAAGAQLADLLTEDGDVDPEKVAAALDSAVDSLGLTELPAHLRPETQGAYVPSEGRHTGHLAGSPTWQELIQG